MSHIVGTSQNFKTEVLDYPGKVLVDFWASWCGPCQMLGPVMEEIAADASHKIKVVKVNIDQQPELANQYQISSIPCVILFEKSQVKQVIVGYHPKQDYLNLL